MSKPTDMLTMSDEDFGNLAEPPEVEASGETPIAEQEPEPVAEEAAETPVAEEEGKTDAEADAGSEAATEDKPVPGDEAITGQEAPDKAEPEAKAEEASAEEGGEKAPAADAVKEPAPVVEESAPNYEEGYNKIMAPFKANGKTIELKSPEEAIALMQMGANYTRKMQELQPHRKTLLALENSGIDEQKLNYLIDLSKHDPAAIQKLIKDSGINPLEIDTESESTYLERNHTVTDSEVAFRTTIDELNSTDEGKATIQTMNEWDRASKDVLWEHPELMQAFHEQKQNGVYDLIATEVERRRTLGTIPTSTSFIHAYQAVGDEMAKAATADAATTPTPKERVVLETKAVTPKPVISNGDKADAASPTRSSPRKAQPAQNFLTMSDEDFMKQVAQFEGRV